jgi:AraC-like DNA-binding protein
MDHHDKFYPIEELEKFTGLSKKSLTLRFREITGQSIHKYQMDNKLENIAVLLRSGNFSNIRNLASDFGFYDEYHLSKCFKKKYGISPYRYSLGADKRS